MYHALLPRALGVAVLIAAYWWDANFQRPGSGWKAGFEPRVTASLRLPYREFVGVLEQSANDPRQHRLIILPNKLVAMCVHDPDAASGAAALSVGVGSFADPPELMGLAHFLEHMLFMGTGKYPAENEYTAYIHSNSGEYNAYTALHETKYYFSIANGALEGALDRFARFFVDPLFDPDCVDRELHAVDSEHKGNLQSDGRRLFQIQRTLSNASHPFALFSTGNVQTLLGSARKQGLDLRQEVMRFYDRLYSADIMTLAVVGNYSVDQLVEWAVAKFSGVANKGATTPRLHGHPLGPDVLGNVVHYETIGRQRRLVLEFGLPELKARYRTGATSYIISLVESRTPGSLHHLLKERGWATHVYAYFSSLDYDGFGAFEVEILLTPAGHDHYEDVVHAALAYLEMLAEYGPQKQLSEELGAMDILEFRFLDRPLALNWAKHLTSRGGNPHIPPEHYITKGRYLKDFGSEDIATIMAHLNTQNYRAFVGTQGNGTVEYTKVEPHYGTPYHVADLSAGLISSTAASRRELFDFCLPARNEFLPTNVTVVGRVVPSKEAALAPELLLRTASHELWFKQDDQFATPQGSIKLQIARPNADSTPRDQAMADLYGMYVAEMLHEELYPATHAGMSYSVFFSESVVNVQVSGFSSKLPLLLAAIVRRVRMYEYNARVFNTSLTQMREIYQDSHIMQPYRQLYQDGHEHTNRMPHWAAVTLEAELGSATSDHLRAYAESIACGTYLKMLVVGDFNEADALDAACQTREALGTVPLSEHQHFPQRNVDFAPGHYVHHLQMLDGSSINGAALSTVYCGLVGSAEERAMMGLLSSVLDGPFFSQLRTQEQLGYVAFARHSASDSGRMVLSFVVQSESNPLYLVQRMDSFIRGFRQRLAEYPDDEFGELVKSQISRKTEAPKSIDMEAQRLWNRIAAGDYDFGRLADEIACLRRLRKQDLLAAWDRYVNPEDATNYTRIDSLMWSARADSPSVADLEAYAESTIALFGCLQSAGLGGVTMSELDTLVDAASLVGSIDQALEGLASICVDKPAQSPASTSPAAAGGDSQVASRLTADGSCVRTALEAALAARRSMSNGSQAAASLASISMSQTPEGKSIITNMDRFKAAHPLHTLPVPAMALDPKYARS